LMIQGRSYYSSTAIIRHASRQPRSLDPGGENRLKLGVLFLPRNHAYFHLAKAGAFEQLMKPHLAEPEPMIGIKLSRFFKIVTEQIEHNNATVLFQNTVRRFDGALGLNRVMQRLTQQNQINTVLGDRRIFQIAQTIFEILKAVLLRQ